MESSASPIGAFIGFWMFVKLVSLLGVAVSVIYALYVLTRIAGQLERLANLAEQRNAAQNPAPQTAPQTPFYAPTSVAPPVPFASAPPLQPPVAPPPPVQPPPPAAPPVPRTTFPTAPTTRSETEPRENVNPEETRRDGE